MTIKIYSTPACPYCRKAKKFFDENKLLYSDVDVSRDAEAVQKMIDKSGQMSVPVIEINGEIIIGFDEKKIKDLLNIK